MEPNKTYPLHPDQDDQSSTPSTPFVNSTDNQTLTPPSTYSPSQNTSLAQPAAVPWYLRPLTKTTQSPLTTTQTRPFVPRTPLPPQPQQNQPPVQTAQSVPLPESEPVSPFRSQPLPPLRSPYANPPSPQSIYRAPSEWRGPTIQQQPPLAPPQAPKPFSQFGTAMPPRPVYEASAKKPKKLRKVIGIFLAILLVAGIGVGVYSLWQRSKTNSESPVAPAAVSNEAEKRLHAAIEKHLQTRYVRQVYEQTTGGVANNPAKFDVTSDFSDPVNPKSHIQYELKSGSGDKTTQGAGEIMVISKDEYFGKLTKPVLLYQGAESAKPKENQWYKIAGDDTTGEMLLDPMSTRVGLNTPMGEVPVGNFQDTIRQELMQFITGRNVYAIKSSDDVTEGNKKSTHYTVEFNAALVNELNKKIADAIGLKDESAVVDFSKNDVQNLEMWVSNETEQITKVKFNREYASQGSGASTKEAVVITISYLNDGSSIKVPDGAVQGPWVGKQ